MCWSHEKYQISLKSNKIEIIIYIILQSECQNILLISLVAPTIGSNLEPYQPSTFSKSIQFKLFNSAHKYNKRDTNVELYLLGDNQNDTHHPHLTSIIGKLTVLSCCKRCG